MLIDHLQITRCNFWHTLFKRLFPLDLLKRGVDYIINKQQLNSVSKEVNRFKMLWVKNKKYITHWILQIAWDSWLNWMTPINFSPVLFQFLSIFHANNCLKDGKKIKSGIKVYKVLLTLLMVIKHWDKRSHNHQTFWPLIPVL